MTSLISQLQQIRATLQGLSLMIKLLIRNWQNGDLDSDSDSDLDQINVSPHEINRLSPPSLTRRETICCDNDNNEAKSRSEVEQ